MKEVYDFAVQLAEKAGQNTLRYFGRCISIEHKDDASPVTIADQSTEELIRAEIEHHFPQDSILGEEFGVKEGSSGYRWILDPIDGTKTFIRGVPLYGTLIALEKEGASLIGVMNFPPLQTTISALRDGGCFRNGEPCHVSQESRLSQAALMMTSMAEIMDTFGETAFKAILSQTGMQRTWADCYGYFLVATGMAEASMDAKMKIWDIAPLIPIIQEAGGTISDKTGRISLDSPHVIASNGILHAELLHLLNSQDR